MFKWFRTVPARSAVRSAPNRNDFVESQEGAALAPSALRNMADGETEALAFHTIAWLENLPSGLRPDRLSTDYPRVANRLALCWDDAGLTDRVFASLAKNTRAQRRGFPLRVADELEVLRAHHEQRATTKRHPAPSPRKLNSLAAAVASNQARKVTEAWEIHSQATSDR